MYRFSSLRAARLELGHERSSGAARGATSLEEIPSRLALGDSLLSQSSVAHGLVLMRTSPWLPLVDAQGASSQVFPQQQPPWPYRLLSCSASPPSGYVCERRVILRLLHHKDMQKLQCDAQRLCSLDLQWWKRKNTAPSTQQLHLVVVLSPALLLLPR